LIKAFPCALAFFLFHPCHRRLLSWKFPSPQATIIRFGFCFAFKHLLGKYAVLCGHLLAHLPKALGPVWLHLGVVGVDPRGWVSEAKLDEEESEAASICVSLKERRSLAVLRDHPNFDGPRDCGRGGGVL
jgi:hypothetical protein